jgi:dipeptidyl aminopeptidase/acylaminoacyl peptidase
MLPTVCLRRLIVCLALVFVSLASTTRVEAGRFTPYHVARTRFVTDALISPDATQIAYVLSVPRNPLAKSDDKYEDGPNWSELHIVRTSDGVSRPYITGEGWLSQPDWKPDGSGLSFVAKRGKDKNNSLYFLPIDGGEARRILTHKTDISAYSWSPDGRHVAFLATEETPKARKEIQEKGFTAEIFEEDFKPVRVWIAELDKPEASPRMLETDGSVSLVEWSPSEAKLAVALAPTPLIDDEYMSRKVHVVDVERGKSLTKIDNPGKLGAVKWSPDGRRLAFISAEDLNDPAEGRLMVADAQTGKFQEVLPKFEGHVSAIAWQDATTVMYLADVGVETTFAKVSLDGKERKTLLEPGNAILTKLTLSKNGKSGAFVGSTPSHPPEVFFMKHGDASAKRLTDSNAWLAEMKLAKQEVLRFKARDGLSLEGILLRPIDEQPRMLYPLILYVHGGPEAHESNGWLTSYARPGQVASASGYFTFNINYRGSTGRGVAFSKLGQGDEAGREFDDLVDAVKHLTATYTIDKSKVGITGGSYGGYASAWGATALTEHFAASVMFVGISDTISKKGTTDIPNEDYLVHTRARPWDEGDKWRFFLERSPIYHVKKARTPILILAGKNDTRVHPGQSMELYRFLKTIGEVPVRLVQYPGEGHGNRKAALKLDYNLRMMQWFDHYLLGTGGSPPPYELTYSEDGGKETEQGS